VTPRGAGRRRLTVTDRRIRASTSTRPKEALMGGYLMWGLILPVLLVVAGIVTIRRRNGRH
jgi:hypothetical protein